MTSWWERKNLTVWPEDLKKLLETRDFSHVLHIDDMNLVFPNIYLGNERAAKNKNRLQSCGVTHVLNMAEGRTIGQVNTTKHFYESHNIAYLGIEAYDTDGFSINKFFDQTVNFIADAIDANGKVLVHCRVGMSRSATIVLAYIMTKHGVPIRRAVEAVKRERYIFPNEGFLLQLCALNDDLGLRDT